MVLCHSMNTSCVVVTHTGGGDTQTLMKSVQTFLHSYAAVMLKHLPHVLAIRSLAKFSLDLIFFSNAKDKSDF